MQCDEKQPCSSCLKHEVPCSLVAVSPSLGNARRGESPSGIANLHRPADNSVGPCASPVRQEWLSHQRTKLTKIRNLIHSLSSEIDLLTEPEDTSSQPRDHWFSHEQYLQDLRLMHHFTTSAALTLADNPSLREAWQNTIPDLSFSCVSRPRCYCIPPWCSSDSFTQGWSSSCNSSFFCPTSWAPSPR